MVNKVLIASLVASAFAFTGCASTPNTSNTAEHLAALQQKDWVLTQINHVDIKATSTKENLPSLRFGDSSLSGTDGCNRLTGGYKVQGSKIQLSQIASTRMMCMDGMELTNNFNQALSQVSRYKVTNQDLELFNSDNKVVLKFKNKQ